MPRRDIVTIKKIIEEMEVGIRLLGDTGLERFLDDELLKRALGMTCINVGELVKVVTDETRSSYKDFPWKAVAGMRDITAYNTVHDDYPVLKEKLLDIIKDINENPQI